MPSARIPSLTSLLSDLPEALAGERFETLWETSSLRLERILSFGHSTPEGEWYDQDWAEWVLLLKGEARLSVEGSSEPLVLRAGDAMLLPARCRHRVEWTPPGEITVWLAVHTLEPATRDGKAEALPPMSNTNDTGENS